MLSDIVWECPESLGSLKQIPSSEHSRAEGHTETELSMLLSWLGGLLLLVAESLQCKKEKKSFLKQEGNAEGIFPESPCGTGGTGDVCLVGMNGCKLLLRRCTLRD